MSTNENTPVESVTDDLDAFSSEFFGQKEEQQEQASSKEDKVVEQNSDALEEDTHSKAEDGDDPDDEADEDDDTLADEGDDEDDEDDGDNEEVDEKPDSEKLESKPKKNRFQERIDELTNARREAERKAAALEERLAKLEQNTNPEPTPNKVETEDQGPSPDDKNEDGSDKYPLGEFDASYIRDLTKHTLEQERKAIKVREAQEAEQRNLDQQRAELQTSWENKLGPAKERYPDFQEKGQQLLSTFESIDRGYGEYLEATIMGMDHGPDVLYYLSNNVDEAKAIVSAGAVKATIALGKLEAKFAFAEEEKQKARPKVSKAPTPPPHVNKGSAAAKVEIDDDTDDLDAFANKFFNKKRRS